MSTVKTLEKCRKIMNLYESMHPSQHHKQPNKIDKEKVEIKKDRNKQERMKNTRKSINSFSKKSITSNDSFISCSSKGKSCYRSISRSSNKENYKASHNRINRFETIMKLKPPKHNYDSNIKKRQQSSSSLNTSLKSATFQQSNNKLQKLTRYQKIMKLKVDKPKVESTLKNYRPSQSSKKSIKHKSIEDNEVLLLKECKQKMQRQKKQSQREERLWGLFERQRQMRVTQKKKNEERQYLRQRSLQKRFDSLVKQELKKMEESQERSLFGERLFS